MFYSVVQLSNKNTYVEIAHFAILGDARKFAIMLSVDYSINFPCMLRDIRLNKVLEKYANGYKIVDTPARIN